MDHWWQVGISLVGASVSAFGALRSVTREVGRVRRRARNRLVHETPEQSVANIRAYIANSGGNTYVAGQGGDSDD